MDILIPRLSWHEDIFFRPVEKPCAPPKKKSKIPLSEAEPMAGFPIGGGHNPSLPPSQVQPNHGGEEAGSQGQPCTLHAKQKNAPTPNWWGRDGADWRSWRWKSVGDGARRQHSSSDCWHKPKHSQPPSTCDKQLSQPSFPGGRPF